MKDWLVRYWPIFWIITQISQTMANTLHSQWRAWFERFVVDFSSLCCRKWWGLGSVCSFEIHENWHSDYNQRIAVNLYILRGSTLERLRALGLVGEELRESKPGGGRFKIWGFVAPFLHNWLLYFLGVSLGINTDLLRNFDTVWLLDEPEDMGD